MLFIVNPISGNGNRKNLISKLMKDGHKVICTEYAGHGEVIARETDDDVVVAVGGDGTVNEVARGIIGTAKTLGIFPCGSGDGLARHIGLSNEYRKAMDTLLAGKTDMIDVAYINDRMFLSVCGVGFDAMVSEKFAKSGKRGLANYIEQAIISWKDYEPEKYTLDIDGETLVNEAVLITVGNSNQWGNGAKVTPMADLRDGELDITVVDRFRNIEIPKLAYRLMSGTVNEDYHVHCYRGRNIRIIRQFEGPAHADGDWFETGLEIDIRIIPHALKVIVP